jgi:hypothetical protein
MYLHLCIYTCVLFIYLLFIIYYLLFIYYLFIIKLVFYYIINIHVLNNGNKKKRKKFSR